MVDKYYKINNNVLHVYCEISDYIDIIEKRMTIFDETNEVPTNNFITITNDKTTYQIKDKINIIKGRIIQTDLYPLFYNIISNILIKDDVMLIHSAALYYNDKAVLVVGDFHQGKTTLCQNASVFGLDTISTDQTLIKLIDNKLILVKGSKYMKICNSDSKVLENTKENIEVSSIINLQGLTNIGKSSIELVENKYHEVKSLFKYITWHADIPLFTNKQILDIDRIKVQEFLLSQNTKVYNVRGNSKEIIVNIKESLK